MSGSQVNSGLPVLCIRRKHSFPYNRSISNEAASEMRRPVKHSNMMKVSTSAPDHSPECDPFLHLTVLIFRHPSYILWSAASVYGVLLAAEPAPTGARRSSDGFSAIHLRFIQKLKNPLSRSSFLPFARMPSLHRESNSSMSVICCNWSI